MRAAFDLGPALLFCPADRPERYEKALERSDAVILDLEDAVAPADKIAARVAVIDSHLDPDLVIVRVNALDSPEVVSDLATLSQTDYRRVMVAKAESAAEIARLDPRFDVVALCETARGVAAAPEIAAQANVVAMMWGAEDLIASLGGTSSRTAKGRYRDVARAARSRVLLSAGAAGIAAIDAVHLDIADVKGLAREARDAAASGFAATACIHPAQIETVRAAYRPDEDTVAWARAVLEAADGQRGVFRHAGRMIDEPVLRHARRVIARGS